MNFTHWPEPIEFPPTHYLFLEKIGPFMETAPAAWKTVIDRVPEIEKGAHVTGAMSVYHVGRKQYRAGMVLTGKPESVPQGLQYELFGGGKYFGYLMKGSYQNMPKACGMAFEQFAASGRRQRDDFCIEYYLNSPKLTPEAMRGRVTAVDSLLAARRRS